jgi:hypothetical protein
MLFQEIISVHSENQAKLVTQNEEMLIVEAGGTDSYHWALKG